jgi:multiple sugar transport system permease protein
MTAIQVPVEASSPVRRSGSSGRKRVERRDWLFVAPFLAVFALVFLSPIGRRRAMPSR